MRILVCLKETFDARLNLAFGEVDEELRRKSLACGLNPADAAALGEAVQIKFAENAEVIALTIGPEKVDYLLRNALAAGADQATRIEDDSFQSYSAYNKARILAGAVRCLKADMVLTGVSSQDNSSGTVAPYLAAWLRWPFVYGATDVQFDPAQNELTVVRNAGRALREVVRAALPAVVAVEGDGKGLPYASLDTVVASREAAVSVLSLKDVGISAEELRDEPARVRKLSFPRPRPRPALLDSSLPAFDRILALLAGGLKSRKVQMLEGDTSAIVEQLYRLLVREKVVKLKARSTDSK